MCHIDVAVEEPPNGSRPHYRLRTDATSNVRFWLGAEVRAPAWRLPLSGGKQTFDLNVHFSADYVRFGPKSGRIDTVTVESARDPKRTLTRQRKVGSTPRLATWDEPLGTSDCQTLMAMRGGEGAIEQLIAGTLIR